MISNISLLNKYNLGDDHKDIFGDNFETFSENGYNVGNNIKKTFTDEDIDQKTHLCVRQMW